MQFLTFMFLLHISLNMSSCRNHSQDPGSSSPEEVIIDGERVKAEKGTVDDLAKIPVSLWSPGQRRSTAGYYFMVAETLALREKTPQKALPLYEAAYNLDPNPFLGGKMVSAKALAGDRSEALLNARKMVLLYPNDAHLRFFYGDMLASGNNNPEAIEQLEKCIDLDPQHEPAYFELMNVYQNQGEPMKALVVAKDLVKSIPSSVAGWSQLSRLYLVLKRYGDALTPARRAWEMQSSNPQLTQIYAVVLQLNGKTKQAVRMYEQLFRMDPTDTDLTARMVALYRELGNLDSALTLLSAIENQDDKDRPAIKMQKVIILWEMERNKEAAQLTEELLKRHPESDRVIYLAGFGAERVQAYERALELYRSLPDQSSLKVDAEIRILLILRQEKKWDEMTTLGKTLIQRPGASSETHALVAQAFADGALVKDALETIEQALEKEPGQPRLVFLKGVYQERLGERKKAIQSMREVIRLEPANSSALNYLGYMFAEKGENLDEAEKLILKALELKPDDGFYTDSLGWVYYQKKDYKKALEVLERASTLEPNEGVIHEHIADTLLKLGQKKSAQIRFQKALQSDLEERDRERIEKKLKDVGG